MSENVTILLIVICLLLLAVLWSIAWVGARMSRNHEQLMRQVIIQGRATRSRYVRRSRARQDDPRDQPVPDVTGSGA